MSPYDQAAALPPARGPDAVPRRMRRGRGVRLVNRIPRRPTAIVLAALPFVLAVLGYWIASEARLAANPFDPYLPSFAQMGEAFWNMAFVADLRSGDYLLWSDTAASLSRIGYGIGISALLTLTLGIAIGFLPYVRATLATFIATFSLIVPITLLTILTIAFGTGEVSKVALIVIGTAPMMIRAMAQAVADIPREQCVKLQTLGASTWQMLTRLVVPQMLPRLMGFIRLGLGPAWIFLVSAEAIAATEGLGYRIFLVRRFTAMDIILPYVAWTTLLAFTIEFALRLIQRRLSRWAPAGAGGAL
jgi:NitT/TauT family transport system permease protein